MRVLARFRAGTQPEFALYASQTHPEYAQEGHSTKNNPYRRGIFPDNTGCKTLPENPSNPCHPCQALRREHVNLSFPREYHRQETP